jgi:chromosomal replication initiator protein
MKCICPHCSEELNISVFVNREPQKKHDAERPLLKAIAEIVCENAGITFDELRAKTRLRQYTKARQQLMYLAKKYSGATFLEIGNFIRPGLDHTTVIHGLKTINDLIDSSAQERREMVYLSDMVESKLLNKAS